MRVLETIISLFIAIVVSFCSIAQFHHHSTDGRMMIYSCNITNCTHSHNHNEKTVPQEECSHGCHDGHHKDEANCSLKISIQKTENKVTNDILICIISLFDFKHWYDEVIECICDCENITINNFWQGIIHLRAPPYL